MIWIIQTIILEVLSTNGIKMNPKFQDGLILLSKTTPNKAFNFFKLILSYHLSNIFHKPLHWGLPSSIAIEPTTSCNLRCPQCVSGLRAFSRNTGMLDEQLFEKTIENIYQHIIYLTFYFQGEPYLNNKFLKMVRFAHQKGIYTATSTNAHYLDDSNARATVESGLSRIIISIDGTTQETFEKYRVGGDLKKVIDGTKRLVSWKKELKSNTPFIIFQFIVMGHNEHQIEAVQNLSKDIGVDSLQLKTVQIYDHLDGSHLLPKKEEYARYNKTNRVLQIKNNLINACWKMWHSCVITWDGNIVPCCFDKDASHTLGNISHQTLKSIWKNQVYAAFRNSILKSRKEIEICKNCSEGLKVWA